MSIVCVKHRYICQLGVRECPECETFQEKLERALQRSIRKHGVKSFEPAPSESNDA